MVADCEARESRLSDWERGFVDDMSNRLGAGFGLNERQEEKLTEIWDKATARG